MAKACCGSEQNTEPKKSKQTPHKDAPDLEIALLGNPNSGKTTLFNLLTGARQNTGNWPGVTVERKEGYFTLDDEGIHKKVHVVDLPGTYSLDYSNVSADEKVARQYVLDHPDQVYVNIIDASTLERGLYLTIQLRELGVPMVVFLNMMDVAKKRNMQIDVEKLSALLGCPVLPVSLKKRQGTDQLHKQVLEKALHMLHMKQEDKPPCKLVYDESVEQALATIQKDKKVDRVEALKLLQSTLEHADKEISALRQQIEERTGEDLDFLLAEVRFEMATTLGQSIVKEQGKISRTLSDKIDSVVLGSWTGIPIFLFLMYLLFTFSINFGGALIDFFDLGAQAIFVDGFAEALGSIGSPQWLSTILANGIGGGVQVVATFIPIIGALFLFLTVLEESGYMARAAFVMDHFMRRLGISGKAFVPLIIGFGCNVPGIMATRTLDNPRERIITVLMSPFMSCGARLAVYALFAAAFFPVGGQNIVFLLYLIGIFFAIMTGLIMRKTLLKGEAEGFFMELPTYQIPSLRNVLINTWNKLKGFILGAGKIIIIVVALINIANSLGTDFSFGNEDTEKSVLSATARTVTPIFKPMGIEQDNWPATVGILTGLLAKEVVVGTLDALYSKIDKPVDAQQEQKEAFSLSKRLKEALFTIPANLGDALKNLSDPLGLSSVVDVENDKAAAEANDVDVSTFGAMHKRFDGKIGAFAYLLFILLYFPCVAATSAMFRETGAKWTMLGVSWSTGLAYASAVIFYQMATIAKHPLQSALWVAGLLFILSSTIYIFKQVGKKSQRLSGTAIKTS